MAQGAVEQTHAMTSVTPSYRRNGKLFSCEPCRRGKLRCDHNAPVCGRCARRNKPEQCYYHPAPLTKPRTSPAPQRPLTASRRDSDFSARPPAEERQHHGLVSPPISNTPSNHSIDISAFRSANGTPLGPNVFSHSPVLTSHLSDPANDDERFRSSSIPLTSPESASMSFRDSKSGFLGPTSYNAVFTENAGSLSVITEAADVDEHSRLPAVPGDRIQQGAEVLSLLRDLPTYRLFTQRWFDISPDGIIVMQPALRIWIDELWSEFGTLLQKGDPDELYSLSELIWRNTRRPMKVHGQMTAREWSRSASGQNLRWEVVGLILCIVGLIATNLSNWDSIFDSIVDRFVDRMAFAKRMHKASEFCLCFCYESEVLNDTYLCFMFEESVLVGSIKGDAHYVSWQRTGEVCDATVALGLHQGSPVDAETPFFLSELRKRIFITAYGHDKTMATFLGRPPRLSYRYCKMDLPLDLSNDQLFLEGTELDAALAELDEHGWNTTGNLSRATWGRIWLQNCRIREDILEIALGSGEEDISVQAEHVRTKLERLYASFPDCMKVDPEQIIDGTDAMLNTSSPGRTDKGSRQLNACYVLGIHVGVVHTEFLLQRALVNRKRTDTKELIPISRRMLQLVLLSQSKKDFFRDFQVDLVGMMAVHGLPAAGVLAIELLKQEQSRTYTPDILPRSETIQDLSVFISALTAVPSGEGNFSICQQGRRALKKVLDQILAPSHPPVEGSAEQPPVFDDMSLYFPTGNDADFLQWLDNFEWDKSMNSNASQESS